MDDELRKELNQSIGVLRATSEYLAEGTKLLVDTSIPGFPSVLSGNKTNIINNLNRVELAILRCIDHMNK